MWRWLRLAKEGRLVAAYSRLKTNLCNQKNSFSTFYESGKPTNSDVPSHQPTEIVSSAPPTETDLVNTEKPLRERVKSSRYRQVDRSKLIHEYYPELRIKPPFFEYEPDRDRLIYRAPYFQAPLELIRSLSTEEIIAALKEYAGFLKGDREILLNRLIFYTRPRPEELIHGKVSSTRMNKTVTVVSRRPCYYQRLKVRTFRFRKFMV